jgi:pimeloyl-ACP methyl ester carboxylesterase
MHPANNVREMNKLKILILVVMISGFVATPAQAQGTIETKYAAGGTWSGIVYDSGAGLGCDVNVPPVAPYAFVYSNNIGAGGAKHPVVVWGNGTALKIPGFLELGDATCYYRAALEHLASWGFIVVASNSGYVGSGQELLYAADEIAAQNADPASPFFNKVDLSNITVAGHSQGAQGAIYAAAAPNSPFTGVLSLSTPNPLFCEDPRWDQALRVLGMEYNCGPRSPLEAAARLSVPVFFVRGVNDCVESATMRLLFAELLDLIDEEALSEYVEDVPCISSDQSDQAYFDRVPGSAAKGTVAGAGHINLAPALGYSTAWLAYTLENSTFEEPDARAAFVGNPAEIETNRRWTNWDSKNLP